MLGLKKYKNFYLGFLTAIFLGGIFAAVLFWSPSALAQSADDRFGVNYGINAGLGTQDIRITVVNIIRYSLGILGTVALLLIIYAGVVWMTAGGNKEKIETAKKIIFNAVIGLIIIACAFAIVQYIFHVLDQSSGGGGGGGGGVCVHDQCVTGCWRCNSNETGLVPDSNCLPCGTAAKVFRANDFQTSYATPGSNSTNVHLCSNVQVSFNNNLDAVRAQAAIANDSVKLEGGAVSGSWQVFGSNLIFRHTSGSEFTASTAYATYLPRQGHPDVLLDTIPIELSVCNPATGCLESGTYYRWNFTTGSTGDTEVPRVMSTYPTSDPAYAPDRNVNTVPVFQVVFSENIDITTAASIDTSDPTLLHPLTGNITIERLDGQAGAVVETLANNTFEIKINEVNGQVINFWPIAPAALQEFAWYRLTVRNIADLCGLVMTQAQATEFQTNNLRPGLAGWYPTGGNVCPDVGVVTFTFNTSMYSNRVSFSLSNGSDTFAANLNSGETIVSDANGTFRIVDTTSPNDYRVYEYKPARLLQTNSDYTAFVSTDRVMDQAGNTLEHTWSFHVTDGAACTCAPYISYLAPSQGNRQECLTVFGQCFTGTATHPATVTGLVFNSTSATVNGSGANYVATSLPANFQQGDSATPQVTIIYNDAVYGTHTTNNTTQSFYVSSNNVANGPCLSSLNPASGCFSAAVSASGSRFKDSTAATPRLVFTSNQAVSALPGWSDTALQASVPNSAQSGEVRVRNNNGDSNPLNFTISCGIGAWCSSDPAPTCTVNHSLCATNYCDPTCHCQNPPSPEQPVVTSAYPACDQACLNTALGARFSLAINQTTLNNNSLEVYPCQDIDGSCRLLAGEISFAFHYTEDVGQKIYELTIDPSSNLNVDQWYRAVLRDAIMSVSGFHLGNLNYDSNNDGANDSYAWTFKTKNEVCALQSVDVLPVAVTVSNLGAQVGYQAIALGRATDNCAGAPLNAAQYNWTWSSSDPGVATVLGNGGSSCLNNSECASNACQSGSCQGAPYYNVATARAEGGPARISAATQGLSAYGELTVDLTHCNETTDCTLSGVCPGSVCDETTRVCTPVINSLNPNSGPAGRWVTLTGCHFKDRGASPNQGQVYFYNTPVTNYPCGGHWTDTEIIAAVPSGATSGPVTVTDRFGLTSNNNHTFGLSAECATGVNVPASGVPGICALNPNRGPLGASFSVSGQNFSDTALSRHVYFNQGATQTDLPYSNWTNTAINAALPASGLTVGNYNTEVEVDSCPSNSLNFAVLANTSNIPCSHNPSSCSPDDSLCAPYAPYTFCNATSCLCEIPPTPPAPDVHVLNQTPNGAQDCRNITATVLFDELMNISTLPDNVFINSSPTTKFATNYGFAQVNPGEEGCTYVNGCTRVILYPTKPFAANSSYSLVVRGGSVPGMGVRSARGGILASTETYNFSLAAGAQICQVATVTIDPATHVFTMAGQTQLFTATPRTAEKICFGGSKASNTCSSAVDCPGGQCQGQILTAISGVYAWTWAWSKQDAANIISAVNSTNETQNVTAQNQNGRATLAATLTDTDNKKVRGSAQIENFLCRYPWPVPPPFLDNDTSAHFSFKYCRGNDDNPASLLPELNASYNVTPPSGDILREYLLLFVEATIQDAIGVRIMDNSTNSLSLSEWYRQKFNRDAPGPTKVDGYEALNDGRTVYVLAANNTSGSSYFPNIYVLSYNEGASVQTRAIFQQLVNNWQFNTNITDPLNKQKLIRDTKRRTDLGGLANRLKQYKKVCSNDQNKTCVLNTDCPPVGSITGTCQNLYPQLIAGSYVTGQSISVWPSWQQTLARELNTTLPLDPYNTVARHCLSSASTSCFTDSDCAGRVCDNDPSRTCNTDSQCLSPGKCVTNSCLSSCPAGHDPNTCWNETTKNFVCPSGSYLYGYQTTLPTSFRLFTNLEYWPGTGSCAPNGCCNFEITN